MKSNQLRKMILDAMVSVTVALVFLFVTESVLRILYPEKVLLIAQDRLKVQNPVYRYHPQYLIDLKPNEERTFYRSAANGGDAVHWKTNRDGFRGDDLQPHPTTRVIVYGDSNIQARFSPLEESFTGRLEQYLTERLNSDCEVVNAGVIGFGPDQSYLKFVAGVDRYKPDIVVFHVFADNDFGDVIRNRLLEIGPDGVLTETGYRATVDRVLKSTGSRLLITRAAVSVLKRLGIGPGTNRPPVRDTPEMVATPQGGLEWITSQIKLINQELEVYKKHRPRRFSHFADHYDYDVALYPEHESSVMKRAIMEAILRKAAATAASKDVKFMVLIQPSSRDLTTNMPLNYEALSKYPGYRQDRLTSIVDDICQRHGIHRVNLFPVFMDNHPDSLYFKTDDDHWNDKGQALAARETARYIHEHFLNTDR